MLYDSVSRVWEGGRGTRRIAGVWQSFWRCDRHSHGHCVWVPMARLGAREQMHGGGPRPRARLRRHFPHRSLPPRRTHLRGRLFVSLSLSPCVCVCVRIKRPSFARVLRFPFDQILVADREMLLFVGFKHTKAYKNIRDT